jgi:hypothetical protein
MLSAFRGSFLEANLIGDDDDDDDNSARSVVDQNESSPLYLGRPRILNSSEIHYAIRNTNESGPRHFVTFPLYPENALTDKNLYSQDSRGLTAKTAEPKNSHC